MTSKPCAEQVVFERPRGLRILLVAEDVDAEMLLPLRRGGRFHDRRRRRCKLLVDERFQLFDRNFQQLRRGVYRGTRPQVLHEAPLALVFDLQPLREPDDARQRAARRGLRGKRLLPLDDRLRSSFRHDAVVAPDEMDRNLAAEELLAHERVELRSDEW